MDPILTKYVREPHSYTLDFYLKHEGYEGLRKALGMTPNDVIDLVKASGLRGRGGAGFPAGMKWQFVLKDTPKPKYIVCNADESEPGTFKDHLLMERNPHLLFEGCLIACHAIGAKVAYIYIRGEFLHVQNVLEQQLEAAYAKGYAGKNVMGLGFDCDIYIHRGRGRVRSRRRDRAARVARRQARAAAAEAAVPGGGRAVRRAHRGQQRGNIVERAVRAAARCRGVRGARAGEKRRPEAVLRQRPRGQARRVRSVDEDDAARADFRLRGRRPRRPCLKAVIPGGSSVPILLPDQLDIEASFDGVAKAGSLLGSAGIIVLDDTTCMVWLAENLLRFYRHESCGKCTPCREGTQWLLNILEKIERGDGEMKDLALLENVAGLIAGKTLCAFGDAAATPALTTLKHFRGEYEAHVREGRCTVPAPWRRRSAAPVRSH